DDSAAHAFADVILGLAFEHELDVLIEERAKALPGAAAVPAPLPAQEVGAGRALRVVDLARRWRGRGRLPVALPLAPARHGHIGGSQHVGEVELGLLVLLEELNPSDDLIQRSRAQLRQMLTHLLGDQEQVVDDVLRPSFELGAQLLVLRGDPGWTGVEVTLPRHIAAERDQHTGAETELFRTEEGRDHYVAPVAQPAVGAQGDALAQTVRDEYLLRFRQSQLPGRAGVLDRGQGRRARASVVAGKQDVVGLRLGDARSDRADPGLRHQLHADPCAWVDGLEVVDQLRQILDRVDVVAGRR